MDSGVPSALRSKGWHWLWLALMVLFLDQATKYLAETQLLEYAPVRITSFFNLRLVYNDGAAFSFLSGAGGWQRWFFIVLGIGFAVLMIHWLRTVNTHSFALPLGLMLILGGDCGNLSDRIFRDGVVVDFLDFHLDNAHWPVFNIADSAICVGLAIVLVVTLRENREPSKGQEAPNSH